MDGERGEALVVDSGEKRLNELGYKQELRREMVRWVFIHASFFVRPPRTSMLLLAFWNLEVDGWPRSGFGETCRG